QFFRRYLDFVFLYKQKVTECIASFYRKRDRFTQLKVISDSPDNRILSKLTFNSGIVCQYRFTNISHNPIQFNKRLKRTPGRSMKVQIELRHPKRIIPAFIDRVVIGYDRNGKGKS